MKRAHAAVMGTHQQTIPDFDNVPARPLIAKPFWRGVARDFQAKAATGPMSTGSGSVLVPISVTGLLTGLSGPSAAMALFANCARIDFSDMSAVIIPRVTSVSEPTFVGEGAPHPFAQARLDAPAFGPANKFLCGAVVTAELQQYTPATASVILQAVLSDKAKVALDKAVFGDTAASPGVSAGLLAGVSDLGSTVGGGLAALTGDLAKIAGAFSTAGVSVSDMFIFGNPQQTVVMRALLSPIFGRSYTIVDTPKDVLADGTIVAVAPSVILSGYSGEPEFEFSTEGVVHMEDASPADITTASVQENVVSLWQSNLMAVRLRLRLCYAPMVAGAVQLVDSVSW